MNNIEKLANIFSISVLLKDYMLILYGGKAKAYRGENGEWYLESEVTIVAIALNDFKDFGWSRNIVTFSCHGDAFDLQLVQVQDLNPFRFAR